MSWPTRVQEIVNDLVARNPDLAHGSDDDRRALTMKMAQQCRYELGSIWGTKSSSASSPQSKDVICTRVPFVGWDTLNGATREANQYPSEIDLTGQYFIEVTPVDHLGDDSGPPPEDDEIMQKLDKIEQDITEIKSEMDKVENYLALLLEVFASFNIRTAHGFISLQPDGKIEYRNEAQSWETFGIEHKE